MPTPDQNRLANARAHPRIMELWWALRPLTSVIRFMQSGAHPDDEISDMLAALAFRDGINLSYACSTRGEGGQNDIGTETGAALGALRTREMERACDVLNMRMYWLSETADDPITDFGFSKSGDETLGLWGEDRTLKRFVDIVRTDRPDILCPTFLDVSGQHGHHRAMTRAAHDVITAAADPGFPSNIPPWQVSKLYLPAWSGAGQSYDDDSPPPPATLQINGAGSDPISGWTWARIGQMSRTYHRTQGMGRWPGPSDARDWPLHLAISCVDGPEKTLASGLARTVGDLADIEAAAPVADSLRAAQHAIDTALAAFPFFDAVADALSDALSAIRKVRATCPDAARDQIDHRLAAKGIQIGHALRHALGVDVRARVARRFLRPGEKTSLTIEAGPPRDIRIETPEGWRVDDATLAIAPDATPSDSYRATYDPADPPLPALTVTLPAGAEKAIVRLPFENDPVILPKRSATVTPDALLLNTAHRTGLPTLRLSDVSPENEAVQLDTADGWSATTAGDSIELTPPPKPADGLYTMPLTIGGRPAMRVQRIDHPHIAATAHHRPAAVRLRVLDAALPDVKVGYIGAGNDRVDHWLRALGADVTNLTDDMLNADTTIDAFDTIVIGIFAMRFRPGLAGRMPRLHRWTEDGGTLVTLYHRPWDNWDPQTIPPRYLEIGQPSLRWRVTDAQADVRHLADHPLLSTPNKIGPEDWEGWVKERGLYFAKSWDAAYAPLLEMADPGEDPHQGSLLVADVGAGRHVHTSLILHYQMENLVPGAFRLMANLIAKRM